MFKKYTIGLFLFLAGAPLFAQEESLLNLLGEEEETEIVKNAFKSTRVINGHSMEMLRKGLLDFRILHRFGPVNGGRTTSSGSTRPACASVLTTASASI